MILIVGGLGFLGANLARYLADQGQKVLITRHRSSAIPSFLEKVLGDRAQVIPLDILNLDEIQSTIRKYEVTSIANLAAIYEGKGDPYQAFQINVQGHVNLLEAMNKEGLKRITFSSSVAVYRGIAGTKPVMEDDRIPIQSEMTFITATKRAAEAISVMYADAYDIDAIIARIGHVYGPHYTTGRNPILAMVKNAVSGTPTLLTVDEGTWYNYIYVKDCVRAVGLLHLRKSLKHRIYNIGVGKAVTLGEVAEAIKKSVPESKIEFVPGDVQPRKKSVVMDISRIRQELDFVPEFTIELGVKAFGEWLREGKY